MARYICPSCGAAYNGRRCKACLYEHFTEEIAHGNHTHRGEPLVIDAPVRQPIPRKDPFGCEKQTRKRKTKKRHPLAGFLVLLALLNSLLPLVRDWGLELMARTESYVTPEPEPDVPIPENSLVLYEDGGFLITAGWQDGQEFTGDFPVYVRNDSAWDVIVSARDIQINGYVMEYSHLYCDVPAGTTRLGIFSFDEQDKVNAGILAVQDISFFLDVYRSDDYESVVKTPTVSLTARLPEGTIPSEPLEGTVVFEKEGIRAAYLGYAYPVSAYDPYAFEDGSLLFLFENDTDRDVDISLMNGCVNGTPADLTAWCSLPAGTKGIASVYAYPLEELGITAPEEIGPLTFQLDVWDRDSYDLVLHSEVLSVTNP